MTDVEQHKNREYFVSIAHEYIKRDGVTELLAHLNRKTDFFSAPASTSGHLSEAGGLCQHSLNVFETSLRIYKSVLQPYLGLSGNPMPGELCEESIAIVSLFHDLCKCNTFKPAEKRRKNERGQWESYQGYEVNDRFPFGQGEKSCLSIVRYMRLTLPELLAIRWNKGMYDVSESGSAGRRAFFEAARLTPLVTLLQVSNMLCAQCIEA